MTSSNAPSWQLILADLALILFIVALSALAQEEEANVPPTTDGRRDPEIAPSQALFRPDPYGPTISEWLEALPRDPRATLTVFAQHSGNDRTAVWQQANDLASAARGSGIAVRVVITHAHKSDIHASLAYDDIPGGDGR